MKNIEIKTYDELLTKIKTYLNEEEIKIVTKSYEIALKKHFGEKRLTGDDYIVHPLNVAYILANISADYQTLSASLLHDVMEENKIDIKELQKEVGSEITKLVSGVNKINRLSFNGDNEQVITSHRKILVGLSEDVRVIIIKLADRLHNMRTLWAIPEERQKRKAKETLDLLTPIAHRLGMSNIKSELEDLSLRYYKPDAYFQIVEKLNQTKIEREALVKEMMNEVSSILNSHNIKHEIKGRAKAIYSIYNKLNKGKKFSDIYDLLALRVYVETESDCYQVLGLIHSKYKPLPKRFKDYIAMPKANMYQSLHTTVFGPSGNYFEIQIRTYEMDKVAENGIASHWSYKEGSKANLQSAMEQKLLFFKSIIDLNDTNEDFVTSGKEDLFKDSIYVFTPKGDVIELPSGSTPIDFAYKVHSEVGDKMVGAIVNDNIVPLDYELKDNDIVKINTNKNSLGPSKEWINMAYTNQAKTKIKSFFSKIDKKDYQKIGIDLLNKELRKKKISITDFNKEENINKILTELKYNIVEDMYIALGSYKITPNMIINIVFKENETKEEIILKKAQNRKEIKTTTKNDIIVEGIDEIKVNIASCCTPIKGDKIIGYITKGNGISIHRLDCPNISKITERIIEVKWNESVSKNYPTNLLIHAKENKNVLLDIIAKTSNTDITVLNINFISNNDNYLYELVVSVRDLEDLNKFMIDVKNIPNILDIERSIK